MKKPACITFSTGFLVEPRRPRRRSPTKGDAIYLDRQDHACIYDGARLAIGADVKKFKHNDPDDLRRLLPRPTGQGGPDPRRRRRLLDGGRHRPASATTSIICDEWDMAFMVDDAHGIGVLGRHGRGTAEHFGLEDRVDLIMGTFSKSLAAVGGFVVGDADVIKYIQHRARALIFTAAPPPASVAAVLAAVDIIEAEPERRRAALGEHALHDDGASGPSASTAATPRRRSSRSSSARTIAPSRWPMRLDEEGVFVNPVVSPAYAAGAGPHPDVLHGDAHEGAPHPRARGVPEGRPRAGPRLLGGRGPVVSRRGGRRAEISAPSSSFRTGSIAGDPDWVPPLRSDVRWMLDEAKNPFWKHARRRLFLARRDGRVVGRIAAIADDEHNRVHADRTAFFGFFECENDPEAARALFAAAEGAASEILPGCDKLRGPVNPSMNDEVGALVPAESDAGPSRS